MRRAHILAPVLTVLLNRDPADRPTAAEAHALLLGDMDPSELRPPRARVSRTARNGLLIGAAVTTVAALVTVVATATSDPGRQGANTLGDNPKTADPCAALPTNTFLTYGQPFLDPEVLNFGTCVMTTTMADGTGQVQTVLDLVAPAEYQPRPTAAGELGEVQRPPAQDNACVRRESLADLNQVVVTTKPLDNVKQPGDLLCSISESVLTDLNRALVNGPFPRRTAQFDSRSLALVDACALLSDQEVNAALSAPRRVGRWLTSGVGAVAGTRGRRRSTSPSVANGRSKGTRTSKETARRSATGTRSYPQPPPPPATAEKWTNAR
ncbi:hypothetical protein GCM10029964_081840 [Kibdelosporangium lantanae]